MSMKANNLQACILALLATMLVSCSGNKTSGTLPDDKLQYSAKVNQVEVITIEKTNFARQLLSNGKLAASRKTSLFFGTDGKIKSVNVHNGEMVRAGATIATLERPDLEMALKSADIALKKSEIDLYDYLAGQGYPSRDTTSIPETLMTTAKVKSGFMAAENGLARAQYELHGTVLSATFNGRIADLKSNRYDQYSVGDSFCTIIDDRTLDVDFTVMESEYSFLSAGLPVRIRPFADEGKEYTGEITSINPSVDANGQISVRARVGNDGSLVDGMNVKVAVERIIPDQLVVPRSAVIIRDNMDVLFTYTPDGKAHWIYVRILYSNGDSHAVVANSDRNSVLNEGDMVIISGNLNLADNSEVMIKD